MPDPFRPDPNPFDVSQCQYTAYRDSRDAFGSRFQVEEPGSDWIWTALMIAALAALAVGWIVYRSA